MGENPAMSDPDQRHARLGLAELDHLVVQEIFMTETAFHADVILPASAWPEKLGTVTNTNRQVQMGRPALSLPGETRQDWWIINEIGKRLGLSWSYNKVEEIYDELKESMNTIDGIKFTWNDRWIHLRGSNTEPIMRIYAEGPNKHMAKELVQQVQSLL